MPTDDSPPPTTRRSKSSTASTRRAPPPMDVPSAVLSDTESLVSPPEADDVQVIDDVTVSEASVPPIPLPAVTDPALPDADVAALAGLSAAHRRVEQLLEHYDLYDDATATPTRADIVAELVRELSIHTSVEERVLYPFAEENLSDGLRVAAQGRGAHSRIKEVLGRLARMDPQAPALNADLHAMATAVRDHVQFEEAVLFPTLAAVTAPERLQELSERLEAATRIAPPQPHPHAPTAFPLNVILGVSTAVLHRGRDLVQGLLGEVRRRLP